MYEVIPAEPILELAFGPHQLKDGPSPVFEIVGFYFSIFKSQL